MAKLVRGPKFGGFPGSDFRSRTRITATRQGGEAWNAVEAAKLPSTNNVFVKIETPMLSEHDFRKFTVTQQLQQQQSFYLPPSAAVGRGLPVGPPYYSEST